MTEQVEQPKPKPRKRFTIFHYIAMIVVLNGWI